MKSGVRALVPGALTITNLVLGFSSIVVAADNGNVRLAAVLIIIAAVIDGLDGKIARFLNSHGAYGRELDSLADIVSFGVAPAFLIYTSCSDAPGQESGLIMILLLLVAVTPMIFGMLRLARFNLAQSENEYRDEFNGLPIPVAAITIVSFVLFNYRLWEKMELAIWMIPLALVVSLLMVSRISYQTMPRFTLRDTKYNLIKLLLLLLVAISLLLYQSLSLFPIALIYIVVGLVRSLAAPGGNDPGPGNGS